MSNQKPEIYEETNTKIVHEGLKNLRHHMPENLVRTLSSRCNFQCQFCTKSYTSSESLKMHIKSVHEDFKEQKCDICDKKFASFLKLRRHNKTHCTT